jgi:hypothetical protein
MADIIHQEKERSPVSYFSVRTKRLTGFDLDKPELRPGNRKNYIIL